MNVWRKRLSVGAVAGLILFSAVVLGRLGLAELAVRRDALALSSVTPLALGETSRLELIPLYEAQAGEGLAAGHGVSYLVRTDSATILLDLGDNPDAASPSPLMQNMAALGYSLKDADQIVISHRHPDHVGGVRWLVKGTFSPDGVTQPALGTVPIWTPEVMSYPGSDPQVAGGPTRLAEGVGTTGSIPYVYPFPASLAIPQGLEQALVVNVRDVGLVVITGCGHMGLASLVAHAEAEFGQPVAGVIGGLHLGDADANTLEPTLQLLRMREPVVVALSPHDSSAAVLDIFDEAFGEAYQRIVVGQAIHVP